jgi:hypothetical protein
MNESNEELIVLPALMSYRDTAAYAFRPPALASVEAAGIRRRRRRRAITGAAAVAVVGLTATIWLSLPRPDLGGPRFGTESPSTGAPVPSTSAPGPSAAPTASATRSPVDIPLSAMLQPEDLGSGYQAADDQELGDWRLEFFTQLCPSYTHLPPPVSQPAKFGERERLISEGSSSVTQAVSLSDVEHQTWELAQTRAFVQGCASFIFEGKQYRLEIVAEKFAGDDSLMVRHGEAHWIYVRQGDVVTQMYFTGYTEQQMKEIAVKAAARLCDTTKAC